jgi:bacterioferritin-associated ferredoxin
VPGVYVCICHAVTDAEVAAAADSGATTVSAVGCLTRAGQSCATCHDTIQDLLDERCGSCPLAALQVA